MRKERRDGLLINDKVIITEDKKQSSDFLAKVFQAVVILLGCYAFRGSFLEAIPLTGRIMSLIYLELLFSASIFASILWQEYNKIKFLIGGLGYLAILVWQLKSLRNGFYYLENIVLKRVGEYYGTMSTQFTVDRFSVERDSFLLMLMIMIFFISLLTFAVVRNRFVAVALLLLLLPVAATFLFGIIPSPQYLISYVLVTLYLSCASNTGHYAMDRKQRTLLHRINSKAAIWLGVMGVLLFFLMSLFLTREKYEGITEIDRTKARIQSTLFDFTWEDFVSMVTTFDMSMDGAAGGINGGKLGGVDRVEFDNSEQLEIRTKYESIINGVYLKGYVGSVYTGHRWVGHSKASDQLYDALVADWPRDPFFIINDENRLLGALTKSAYPSRKAYNGLLATNYYLSDLSVTYKAANRKYLYVPYYPEYNGMKDVAFVQDMYSSLKGRKKEYSIPFYRYKSGNNNDKVFMDTEGNITVSLNPDQIQVDEISDTKEFEKSYRQFVYRVYTQLPEKGVERIIEDFAPMRVDKEYDSVIEKITYVRDYLKENVDYSLEPGKTPWNKDFVEYFLYENKKGYCAHFASAATVMLRAMGVPCRYVEGYAVSSKDVIKNIVFEEPTNISDSISKELNTSYESNEMSNSEEAGVTPGNDVIIDYSIIPDDTNITVSVKDYSAHSWVEVYMDGCGWIPIDVTPGSDMGISAASSIGKQAGEELKATPTPKAATPTPRKENITQQAEDRQDNTAKEGREKNHMDVKWIIAIVLVIWLVGTALGFVAVRFINRIIRSRTKDLNKKAILLYEQIEGLLKAVKAAGMEKNALLEDNVDYAKEHCAYLEDDEFERIMEIIRRARFGKETIAPEELQQVKDFYFTLKGKLWGKLSIFRKMYLKLTLFL